MIDGYEFEINDVYTTVAIYFFYSVNFTWGLLTFHAVIEHIIKLGLYQI